MRSAVLILAALGAAGAVLLASTAGSDVLARGCAAIPPSGWQFTANCDDAATAALHSAVAALLLAALATLILRRRHA